MAVSIQDIQDPKDLRQLNIAQLLEIAQQIRDIIINTVSKNGGHLGPPLGVVELTLALHYAFDTPKDKVMWDVGHQAYAHKILTGRRDQFSTLKKYGGISGYPNIDESEYDLFTVGHSSTSISQALGMATVRDLNGGDEHVIAVVGDGALTAGMAFEAINNAGQLKKNLIVVLNDNEMSISKNVGAMAEYLNRIIIAPLYNRVRHDVRDLFKKLPDTIGDLATHTVAKVEEGLKGLLVPGMLFEELGFLYSGPIDGHNLPALIQTFNSVKKLSGPILLHVITTKGKGYKPAEVKPDIYHGISAFNIKTGVAVKKSSNPLPFTKVFSKTILDVAQENKDVVALTAAMPTGVGLSDFAEKYPDRFFDVGIAEQHCVTYAGALAKGGKRPIAAIYATFLQRALDQVLQDVCLQRANVLFCLDRMGIVGEDGATHNGVFTIPLLRAIPEMKIMLPKDGSELSAMLRFGLTLDGPATLCYPKDTVQDLLFADCPDQEIQLGKAEVLQEGQDVAIFAIGSTVPMAFQAIKTLQKEGLKPSLVNLRFVKPLDHELIKRMAETHKAFLIVEEGTLMGGVGSAVMESLEQQELQDVKVKRIGIKDKFIEHGARSLILEFLGISEGCIVQKTQQLNTLL